MITYSFCSLNLKSLFGYIYSAYTFVLIAADNLTNHQACVVIVWCSFSFAASVHLFYLFIFFLFLISFFLCSGVAAMQILFIFGSMIILQCML